MFLSQRAVGEEEVSYAWLEHTVRIQWFWFWSLRESAEYLLGRVRGDALGRLEVPGKSCCTSPVTGLDPGQTSNFTWHMSLLSRIPLFRNAHKRGKRVNTMHYYTASSVNGQDEPNRALWLATRAGKMEPSCPLGTTRCIPQAKFH